LTTILGALKAEYDYVVIDSAPTLSSIMTTAVSAADVILVPIATGSKAAERLAQFVSYIWDLRHNGGRPQPKEIWISPRLPVNAANNATIRANVMELSAVQAMMAPIAISQLPPIRSHRVFARRQTDIAGGAQALLAEGLDELCRTAAGGPYQSLIDRALALRSPREFLR
jgi:cellulose biosynthesis protein BcsQ